MTHNPLRAVVQRLQRAVPMHGADLCDADLLERYVAHRDELAFAELVRRHGAMVLATCRRILGNDHDAEDAFQATFFVLVKKAATIRPRAMIGNFLYGVAYTTALKANAMKRKRSAREREAGVTPRPAGSDQSSGEVQALDEELSRLPERYRVPIVLCELQGKTQKEVARQLGWPEGTVASRLSRGRRLLAERLTRRGLSAGVVTASLSEAGAGDLPAALLTSTVRGAAFFAAEQGAKDLLSPTVIALTEGVLKGMLLSKLKVAAVVALPGLVVAVLLLLPAVSRPVHSAAPPPIRTALEPATVASAEPVEFANPVNLPGLRAGTSAAVIMAVSPDGRLLVTGHEKGEITWRDAHTGAVRQTLNAHEDAVTALVFSGDGKLLATSSPDMVVKVWDAQTYRPRNVLKGHKSWVYSLAFSSDSKTLASGSYDRTVRLWDPVKGETLATLEGHKASVRALAFSPDGRLLASGSSDNKVHMWNVKSRTSKAVLKGADNTIHALSFSADGKMLAAVSEMGGLHAWDVDKATLLAYPPGYKAEVTAVAFSPTGRHVVTSVGPGALTLRDAGTGKVRHQWSAGNVAVRALSFGPGGRQLFSLGEDGSLMRWSSVPGPLRFFDGHIGPVRGAVFSSDGKYLLSWSGYPQDDRTLGLWDVKTARQVRILMAGRESISSAAFSPDIKYAAAGESTGIIQLFEVETGKKVRKLEGHKGEVASARFSSGGRWLLSAGFDRTVRLWDAQTGALVRIFTGHTDPVRCAIFHSDGKRILSGGADGTVRVWDRQGRQLKSINHKARIENLMLLPDGKRYLSSSLASGVQLWDLEQDRLIRSFRHAHGASWVGTTKDGRRAVSASHDGRARLWDVETAKELHTFGLHRGWVRCVDVSPDGSTFITGSGGVSDQLAGDDCTIRLWKLPP
jgi:RNA polymerase sigma factor (sigma-70 family)